MKKLIVRKISEDIGCLHEHPLLSSVYAARGVRDSSEISYDLKNLLPYERLKGVGAAVELLASAIEKQQSILIVGDFDTDGATSTVLAILALRAFGLQNVSYLIPSRFGYGYGLSPEIVQLAAKSKPDMIVTVDNGISSTDGVAAANALGIKVLITDHHLPGDEIPDAHAIVNPSQDGDDFLSKNLAGVGVIFYLMLALRAYLRKISWFDSKKIAEPNMAQFLDLVALGTVADSVVLDHNNRTLVSQGLIRIRSGNGCLGIRALFGIAKRNYEKASVVDLGFAIAPRLNAAGRLDDMSLGVECLLTEDPVYARTIAKKLNVLNDERREISEGMQVQASGILDELQLREELPPGVCIFEETWHQGVLGILAARLKEKLSRPVIAFAMIGDDEIKGSARSINGVHIRDVISNIASKYQDLITKFGGHAMAAGLSLPKENYEVFKQAFAEEVHKQLMLEDLRGIIYTDGELPVEYFNLEVAELLRNGGPWGAGFSEPEFFGEFALVGQKIIGKKHLKLVLQHLETKKEFNGIYFNVNPASWPNLSCSKAKMVYRLNVNEYNGVRSLQLIISEIITYE